MEDNRAGIFGGLGAVFIVLGAICAAVFHGPSNVCNSLLGQLAATRQRCGVDEIAFALSVVAIVLGVLFVAGAIAVAVRHPAQRHSAPPPPGWYPYGRRRRPRWWDGHRWGDFAASPPPGPGGR